MNITKQDLQDYVAGWLIVNKDDPNFQNLDFNNCFAAIANALSQIECDQDGLKAYVKRKLNKQ